ncbi:MAG: LysR substrate-binding domain-containing protein [Burkholderiaceae bacterium]
MNLQQLKILREASLNAFNLTDVALALGGSQSGVSKAIKELEDELGLTLFVRRGKKVVGFTDPGEQVLHYACLALEAVENMHRAASQFDQADEGRLVLATTHTQARYSLPEIVRAFRERFPKVRLALRQASPSEIAQLLETGEADIAVATESLKTNPQFVCFPFFNWYHGVVVPEGHALAKRVAQGEALSLQALAEFPIITYHEGFTGRPMIDACFRREALSPDIVMEALDADVIKAYVSLGMGVGLIASVAFDDQADAGLVMLDASEIFSMNTTVLALRRARLLPGYAKAFVRLCVRGLDEEELNVAINKE